MDYLQHISSHFLAEKSKLPAWRKLEQFIAQFVGEEYGEGHILFACHAAFPVVLTPDLLYQLWLNFQKYQNENGDPQSIHRIAVSDLLLSPLVREVGTEVFEMPEVIRTALLDCLEHRFKLEAPHRMNELAQFLMQYYNNIPQGGNYIWDHLRDIQEWHAMAYLKPDLAAHKLREAISDAVRSDQKGQQYRLQMLVEKIDHQFEKLGKEERHKDTFQTLVAYSKGMKAYHEGEYDKAVQSFSNLPTTFVENDKEVEGDVFTITVPKPVQQQLEEQKREEQKNNQKIYAAYIAIGDYANISKLSSTISDARKVQNWVDGYASANQIEVHTQSLFDEAATEDAVTGLIIHTLENAQTEDMVFFYFAGTGVELPKENPEAPRSTFACHEFELLRNQPIGGVSDVDMRSMLRENNPNNAFVTLVFDACNIGVSSWIDVNNPKQVMLSASRVTEKSYELREGGIFTSALLKALEQSNGETSYQRLKEQIDQFVAGDFQQTTQVFGSELAIARKFLGIGTGIDLRTTELLLETNNGRDSKAESIEQFLDAYQFEPPQNINHLLTQVRDQQSLDQLSVLNISGGQQADLFERITSELVSPAIEYHHHNLENDFGGSNPFSKVQAQSNIQQQSNIGFANESFELKSSLEDRIDAAHIIFLAVSPWLIRQMRLDPKIGELLEEAMMNRIPIFPILVQNCDWESTIIRRIGIFPDGRNAARKDDDFIPIYEEKLKSTLSIWQKAKIKNIKSFIVKGALEDAFKELNQIVASNTAKNNQLLQLEASFKTLRNRRNSATIADRAYQININRINASILSFIEELSIEDLFDVQITFEAEEGTYAETEAPEQETTGSKQQFLWCLDNGHGSFTSGKRSPIFDDGVTQFFEYEFNRDIVSRIMPQLDELGIAYFQVVPEVEIDDILKERVERANTKASDLPKLFVSVHCNAGPTSKGSEWADQRYSGVETWHAHASEEGKRIATIFQKYLVAETGFNDRGLKTNPSRDFYVLARTNMPAILTENGFYNNKEEALELMKDEVRQRIADAHVKAILEIERGIASVTEPEEVPEQAVETESNNPNWFTSKPYEIGLFSVSRKKRRETLLKLSKEHHYPLFELMESALSTEYEISYEGVFIFKEEGNEIFSGESRSNLEEEAKYFLDTVHQYLQWRYLLTVETTSEVISPEDYEIEFLETEEQKLKKATIKLLSEKSDGLTISELSNQLALKSRKLLVATLNKLLEQQLVERYNRDKRSRNRLTDKGLQYAEFVQQNESENTSYSVKEWFEDIPLYVEEGELATFEIKVSNTSKKELYVNALVLWPDFSISNQFLPLGQLQAGEELYLSNHKQELISQQVIIDVKQWLGDTRESFKVRFKIFVSTEPYETNGLNQLPLFGSQSYDTWRDIPYMLTAEDLAGELISVEVKKIEEDLSNFDSYLLLSKDELEEEIEEEEEEEEE